MHYTFTAVFIRAENGDVVAYLEELPGAHGQGATVEQAEESLRQAAEMVLAANRQFTHESFASGSVFRRSAFRVGRLHVE